MRFEHVVELERPLKSVSLRPAATVSATEAPRPAVPDTPAASPKPTRVSASERESVEAILSRLEQVAEELRAQQREQLLELQRDAIKLAIAIASHLIHEQILLDEHGVEALVQKTVSKLESRDPVTVWLHPDDLRQLQQRLGDRPLLPLHSPALRLESDPAQKRGDCRAAAGEVSVQWLLADQIAEIREHLLVSVG